MAAVKTFVAAEVLYASDLNALNTSILNNALSLISPLTGELAAGSNDITGLDELAFNDAAAVPSATARLRRSGNNLLYRDATASMPVNMAKGADIASAAALALGTDGLFFDVTGTVTITSISSRAAGALLVLQFDGALTVTHNATTLILLGATNYATATGDVMVFVSEGGGNWREIWRRPVTGATSSNFFRGDGTWASAGLAAATQAEMEAASSTTVGATPGRTHFHPGVAKTWCKFNAAGTVSVSYNVTSVTDTGAGNWTVNVGTDFSGADWAGFFWWEVGANRYGRSDAAPAAGTLQLFLTDTGGTPADMTTAMFAGFGDQA